MLIRSILLLGTVATMASGADRPRSAPEDPPAGRPAATIDLGTREGVALVNGAWRYSDVKIVEVEFRGVGADLKPTGAPNKTYDVTPRAGAADFDDSAWPIIDPASLASRRSNGRVSFNWYRIAVTIPQRIGAFDPTGSIAVFEITVDDYAEVWVDGQLPRELERDNHNLVRGWNAPNRVTIARHAKPGQEIQLAVFGINGPISDPPPNYIWIRSAKVEFYAAPRGLQAETVELKVVRASSEIDDIVPKDASLVKLADGFMFTEGPVWHPDGYLLFSDPNENRIYRWSEYAGLSVFREHSGYSGADVMRYRQPGSNGLALDRQNRLTIDEHGNRRITRLANDGSTTVLADRYEGRRLNSPNDLIYHSNGSIYFTDPPFGLPELYEDPAKELPYSGVFRLSPTGELQLLDASLKGPNGIAFSPDERFLYVGNWDEEHKVVMRYPINSDGSVGTGTVFFDLTKQPGEEAIDGVKVDANGNVYISGPGGLWIVSPEGKHLGTLQGPELAANFAWGDVDRRTLYLTARTGLYRIRLNVAGSGPWTAWQRAAER